MLDTSALFPSETKCRTPRPIRRAVSRRTMPTPPDWEATARPPAGGRSPPKVASSRTSGWLSSSPRQLGPTTRMSCARAARVSSRLQPGALARPSRRSRRSRPRRPAHRGDPPPRRCRRPGRVVPRRRRGREAASSSSKLGDGGHRRRDRAARVDGHDLAGEPAVEDGRQDRGARRRCRRGGPRRRPRGAGSAAVASEAASDTASRSSAAPTDSGRLGGVHLDGHDAVVVAPGDR